MRKLVYSLFLFLALYPSLIGSLGISTKNSNYETIDLYHRLIQLNIYRQLGYSDEELFLFSTYIETSARHYGINQYIMAALFDVESKFGTQKLRWTRGKATDFGWGQIHIQHLTDSTYDPVKLLNDDQYSIEAAFSFMADIKKRYGKRETIYHTRYHSFTPKLRARYLNKLKDSMYLLGVTKFVPGFQEIKPEPLLCEFPKDGNF